MSVDSHLLNIIKVISNVTDAFTTALFLADPKDESLTLQSYYSLSKNVIPRVQFGYGDGMVGWVAKNNKPIIANQFDRDTTTLQFYSADEDIKSFMAVPLPRGKGVLSVDSKNKYIFTEKSQKLLLGFADLIVHETEVSDLQAKERLYDRILNLHYQADRIGQQPRDFDDYLINILTLCLSFTRAEMGFVAFLSSPEPDAKYSLPALIGTIKSNLQRQQFSVEKGLVGWIFRKRKPLVLEKIGQEPRKSYLFTPEEPFKGFNAFLGIPCLLQDFIPGVMGFTSYSKCTWETEEIDALLSIGQRIILTKMSMKG
ncbi:MAG: GAF domain-containing protein [Desulfovibrionales bacterium]|nr:GAF domain-containing protein [Desulfovibrionales bacterium]